MKPCRKCGGTRRGAFGRCLDCKAQRANARYYANHERLKTNQRDYNKSEKGIISRKKYQASLSSQIKFKHNLRSAFGLTVEDYAWMLHRQDFCCACCGDALKMGKHTHVDHDHVTGKVRSILCHFCNTSLGMLKESPERVHALLRYLERHR